jgi:hypothetical protein
MGDLPMRRANATAAVDGRSRAVAAPQMISTSGRIRTGLKKRIPQNRSGRRRWTACRVIGMVEVFGSEDGVVGDQRFQAGEEFAFGVRVLHDRLDDQRLVGERFERIDEF